MVGLFWVIVGDGRFIFGELNFGGGGCWWVYFR